MASPPTAIDRRGHLRAPTLRTDTWWLQPLVTVLVLLGFVAYGIWVAFVDKNYFADPYISPFYSPCLAAKCGDHATAAIFGSWWLLSPALIVLPFPIILLWDAVQGMHFADGWGVGLGSLVLLVNAVLLGLYSLSCHSCRHLCGGQADRFSKAPVRFRLWRWTTALNSRHMLYAWVSLVFVALTDLYVRLVAVGTIHDPRFF